MGNVHLVPDLDGDKDRNFVTALARGLDVLRCFRPHETLLSNAEIATRTGLPKPTVSRLLHTLCKLDYLASDESTGSYRLSSGVLTLGFGVIAGMEIADRAKGILLDLRDGPNSYITAAVAQAHMTDAVYIAVERSFEDISLAITIGARLPLFFSAIGRANLVGMSDDARATAFEYGAKLLPDSIAAQKASYASAKAEFEEKGYCSSYGDWRKDVHGIAVPIKTLDGRVFAINAGGPAINVKQKQLETVYAPRLIKAAKTLSLQP
jgi:DNA-binding IclR family transcriptional regulator